LATIDSVLADRGDLEMEVVVVDNNSTDETRSEVARYSELHRGLVRYTFERRTAFTKARSTGREQAKGEVLLYIDDDILVVPGSLRRIPDIFVSHPDAGIVAGKIMPRFIRRPPPWALRCQDAYNGWSLLEAESVGDGKSDVREVQWAFGPMMAMRARVYDEVGGFPPDTIGVETNKGTRTFRKLYVGPGDVGLCHKAAQAGYKVYFTPDVACYHVIPPIRFSVQFWRSRMIGEGHYVAVSQREFYKLTADALANERKQALDQYFLSKAELSKKLGSSFKTRLKRIIRLLGASAPKSARFCSHAGRLLERFAEIREHCRTGSFRGVHPEEIWLYYYKAYLETDFFLEKYPYLGSFLWKIASDGIRDEDFEGVVERLPSDYRTIFLEENNVYDDNPLNSTDALKKIALHPGVEPAIMDRGEFGNTVREKVEFSHS
jgi:glycosyltransferase involved in cell wall biosynthesis